MDISRRRALFMLAAPAIVRAASLMPVSSKLLSPDVTMKIAAGSWGSILRIPGALSGMIEIGDTITGFGIEDGTVVVGILSGGYAVPAFIP